MSQTIHPIHYLKDMSVEMNTNSILMIVQIDVGNLYVLSLVLPLIVNKPSISHQDIVFFVSRATVFRRTSLLIKSTR